MATTTKKKKGSEVEDFASEVDADLGNDFDMDAVSSEGEEKIDWVGKKVRFEDPDGKPLTGEVTSVEGDGTLVILTGDGESEYDADPADVEVIETKKKSKKASKKPGKKPAAKAEAPANGNGANPPGYEIRLLEVAKIKIPKVKVRDKPDTDDPRFKRFVADIKSRGLDHPILVTDFDKPSVIAGLGRMTAYEVLGWDTIPARAKPVESVEARLFASLAENEQRRPTHWLDMARTFLLLTKDKVYSQRQVGKAFGYGDADVSRMIAALKLPPKVRALAQEDDYPRGVFLEMVGAPVKAVTKLRKALEEKEPVTVRDARKIVQDQKRIEKKAEKDAAAAEGAETPTPRGRRPGEAANAPTRTMTSVSLPTKALGSKVRITVHGDAVDLRIRIPHDKKTFRDWTIEDAVTQLLEEIYADEDCEIGSDANLRTRLQAARAEIPSK